MTLLSSFTPTRIVGSTHLLFLSYFPPTATLPLLRYPARRLLAEMGRLGAIAMVGVIVMRG